ncbi:MAG: 3'-5' exoribonuclease YhaM [Isosphaeraceae bacterium]|jgi:3'-5' exoribonuclease|nr:MAG: 3'-5' exoribonuclease YhaM [Isosphaeraceae bacterium]
MSANLAAPPYPLKNLYEIEHDEVADCFALLVRKESGRTKKDEPYWTIVFRDRRGERSCPLWHDSRFFRDAAGWVVGNPYRLTARGQLHARYGLQLELLDIRPVDPERDAADGFDLGNLVEVSHLEADQCWNKIRELVERYVPDTYVRALIERLLDVYRDDILRIQAAERMHHAYTGGLIEHVWSMTRIAVFLAEHYERYYARLNPPLNRSVVVAAAILHDIGKLRELEYHPVAARYTTPGKLIGHVVLGRDMVREAAAQIEGFPPETLMLLEHAILAHHGKREFGAVVEPATIEALIVSFVDELDAKINQVAEKLLAGTGEDDFTERIYGLDNRRFYRGTPSTTHESPQTGS